MTKTVRIQIALALAFIFGINFSLKAQPGNLPAPYCMPLYVQSPCNQSGPSNTPGNFINDFIHSVKTIGGNVDINNIASGCNAQNFPSVGFRNYIYHKCQHNLSVTAGQAITFSIQVGNIYAQGVAVFIDWNNDNIFSTPSEMVASSPGTIPGGGWGTYTVNIPGAQPNGIYRMRVRCVSLANGPSINPCNNYSGGEAEDYDIYVGTISSQITASVTNNSPLCAGNTLSLNLTYTSQCTPTYTWFGPNAFTSGAQNPTITNSSLPNSGNYTLSIMCNTVCPYNLVTNVVITPTNMVANAGPSLTFCTQSAFATFSASPPAAGSGTWSVVSGTANIFQVNQATANVGFNAPVNLYNVFAWTIGAPGCTSTSTMSVTFHTAVANAGPSQTLCSQNSVMLNGNIAANSTGSWTLISGIANITSPTSATTNITSLGIGTNIFQWTLTHPFCGSNVSQVTITNYATPTLSAISSPTVICNGNQATLTASGAAQYNWQPSGIGSVIIVSPTVASTYTIIGSNGPCFGAPITISLGVDPAPSTAIAGPSLNTCVNTVMLSANSPSIGTGIWSVNSGSATITNPNSPNTTLTNISPGTNILQWTTSLGNCTSTSTIIIQNNAVVVSASSNMSIVCVGGSATLIANGASNYTWLPSGGNSSVEVITPTSTAVYTVSGTNGTCSASSSITQSVSVCTRINAEVIKYDQLKVYPNPFKDELKIVSEKAIQIKLLEVSGKEIMRKEIKGEVNINTAQLAKGIYFIHFIGNPSVKPVKVIKD